MRIVRLVRTETWGYAALLVILFMIASVAVVQIISYLETHLAPFAPGPARVIAMLVWTLTIGFMFIAGAFGLWTVKFSAEAESRRRVGRFVDAMNYLSDGLIAVDSRGRITGSNPVANRLAQGTISRHATMDKAFPNLTPQDIE